MKANKLMLAAMLVAGLTMAFNTSCKKKEKEIIPPQEDTTKVDPDPEPQPQPQGDMPVVEQVAGKGVVVINVAKINEGEYYCNGFAMRGENVAGGSWEYFVNFEAIEGFDGWYKAVVDLGEGGVDSEGEAVLYGGHPCLNNEGGVPDWNYEWTKSEEEITVLEQTTGDVHITNGNINFLSEGVIYIEMQGQGWKDTPCVEPDLFDIAVTVNTPAIPAEDKVFLTGAFDNWSGGSVEMTPNAERTVWTATLTQVQLNKEVKATLGGWDENNSMRHDADKACWVGADNAVLDDLTVDFTVENFYKYIPLDEICCESATEADKKAKGCE
ncbi:MAG: hypothetical protein IJ756_06785 [Paludibacteraceae bacterium]|nr:hypothetical protein [Paludibacteraceae bacterium]